MATGLERGRKEYYRVQLSTGTTNVDRYLPFTNYAVLSTNAATADVVASDVVNRFLPANATETLTYDNDGNLTADGRWTLASRPLRMVLPR